jgi:hypothetical protein
MATPSKNQRSGPKAEQKKILCPVGHVMRHARLATRGRMLMIRVCDCTFPEITKGGQG